MIDSGPRSPDMVLWFYGSCDWVGLGSQVWNLRCFFGLGLFHGFHGMGGIWCGGIWCGLMWRFHFEGVRGGDGEMGRYGN